MNGTIQIACDLKNVLGVKWHRNLVDLVGWVVDLTGEIIITSGHRFKTLYKLDSGLHLVLPLRSIDIRSWIYNNPESLCDSINRKWQYDKNRPKLECAVYHDTGNGIHIHLQVHDLTCGKP